jgi:hypothetical protein
LAIAISYKKVSFLLKEFIMLNLISPAITASITKAISVFTYLSNSLFSKLQTKQFISMVLVVFLLLTTNVKQDTGNPISNLFDKITHQGSSQQDSQRPKTTGEWNKQAQETEGKPAERLKRIGEQSVDAVKDLGAVYPDTVKRSADSVQND